MVRPWLLGFLLSCGSQVSFFFLRDDDSIQYSSNSMCVVHRVRLGLVS